MRVHKHARATSTTPAAFYSKAAIEVKKRLSTARPRAAGLQNILFNVPSRLYRQMNE